MIGVEIDMIVSHSIKALEFYEKNIWYWAYWSYWNGKSYWKKDKKV